MIILSTLVRSINACTSCLHLTATTKEFFKAKMTEGFSVHDHNVKMLQLIEKLDNLGVGLDNDTHTDVILQSLPSSFDQFVVKFNMNGLEKFVPELINILAQFEATVKKPIPVVLVALSTSKSKGKKAHYCKKNGNDKGTKDNVEG